MTLSWLQALPDSADGSAIGSALLPEPNDTVTLLPHAAIAWRSGRFVRVEALPGLPPPGAPLLLPGLVDLHVHWPQWHVRGQFSGQLLPWLRDAIWPAEAEFADVPFARARAQDFAAAAVRAGTCAGLLFGPPFAAASVAAITALSRGFVEGPALMEQHCPLNLASDPVGLLAQLVAQAPGHMFAITPRFAPNVSAAALRACGHMAAQTGWPVQSHLSENLDEVRWVRELFAEARDYTDVYDAAGLLGQRSIFAHAVHCSDRELSRLAETGTWIAHCPTSNVALGSGRMPVERVAAAGVPWVLATDVGAGPQLSQLDVMRTFFAVHRGHAAVSAGQALCRSTAVPGTFLAALDPQLQGLGTIAVGAPAHLVAVPCPAPKPTAEAMLQSLLHAMPAHVEQYAQAVVQWGQLAFASAAG